MMLYLVPPAPGLEPELEHIRIAVANLLDSQVAELLAKFGFHLGQFGLVVQVKGALGDAHDLGDQLARQGLA